MAGHCYVVVKAIPYEQPELLAVWVNERDARDHLLALKSADDGRHFGVSPYAVWLVPFQVRTEDPPPTQIGIRIVSTLD